MGITFIGTDLNGYAATTNDETYILQAGDTLAKVTGSFGAAFNFAGRDGVSVVIGGEVYSTAGGVTSYTTNSVGGEIHVLDTGYVVSDDGAVAFNGDGFAEISNSGTLIGQHGIAAIYQNVAFDGSGAVSNFGTVIALESGIIMGRRDLKVLNSGHAEGQHGIEVRGEDGMRLENHGTILGQDKDGAGGEKAFGVYVISSADHTLNVINDGTISGEDAAIKVDDLNFLYDFQVYVKNSGVMNGDVLFAYADDRYVGRGDGYVEGVIDGGSGKDRLTGAALTDFLVGGDDEDVLKGRGGEDELTGGEGKDRMTGGGDADLFIFETTSDSLSASADVITDFKAGIDQIDLGDVAAGLSFETSGFSGTGASMYLSVTGSGTTNVRVDADGDGSEDMRIILRGSDGLDENDFIL